MFLGTEPVIPSPVYEYLNHVLQEGQPIIRTARIKQHGEMRLDKNKGWIPFQAEQCLSAIPREFIWEAQTQLKPLVKCRVRDAYVSGSASSEVRIFSLFVVSSEQDSPEMNSAALQRYLGESVWLPSALIPGCGLKWSPINEKTALATLNNRNTSVSLRFEFNKNNEVTSVSAPGRYRKVGKKFELTPWIAHTQTYREIMGILIPVDIEVEWQLPKGSFCWFRAKITDVSYEFDQDQKISLRKEFLQVA